MKDNKQRRKHEKKKRKSRDPNAMKEVKMTERELREYIELPLGDTKLKLKLYRDREEFIQFAEAMKPEIHARARGSLDIAMDYLAGHPTLAEDQKRLLVQEALQAEASMRGEVTPKQLEDFVQSRQGIAFTIAMLAKPYHPKIQEAQVLELIEDLEASQLDVIKDLRDLVDPWNREDMEEAELEEAIAEANASVSHVEDNTTFIKDM